MLADVRFMISLHFLLWNLGVGNCTVVFVVNTMFLNFLSSTQGTSSSYLSRYCSRPNCIFKVTMTLVAFVAHWLTVLHWLIIGHWSIRKVIWVQTADCSSSHKPIFRVNFSIQSAPECMIFSTKFPQFSGGTTPDPLGGRGNPLSAPTPNTAFHRTCMGVRASRPSSAAPKWSWVGPSQCWRRVGAYVRCRAVERKLYFLMSTVELKCKTV